MDGKNRLLVVLHGHIPDVVGHGTWPHGANWLYEAAAEAYLPFLRNTRILLSERVPVKATVGMTPVLAEQLQDDRFKRGFRWYLRQRSRAAAEDIEEFALLGDAAGIALAERWRDLYKGLKEEFEALPGLDIIRAFRELAEAGVVEPIASGATHGFLPLLPNDRAIARQLDVGLEAHERHFGRPARGIWLPECAYRPAGPWHSPVDGHVEIRSGLEDFLSERGVEFFFVETHLVSGGLTIPAYGGQILREDEGHSPYRPHALPTPGGRFVNVFARDPLSSQQVWSGKVGYPGDGRYLEFHKKRAPSGHRYWRVTDSRLELEDKQLYEPDKLAEALDSHSKHFVSMLTRMHPLSDGTPPLVVAMFDFELFGHWWFEGPEFLREVYRKLSSNNYVKAVTASEALAETPSVDVIAMPPGTWGRDGDFQVWWNSHTISYWSKVEDVEKRMESIEQKARAEGADAVAPELFEALERQALLLQSSDWPFLIDNEVARDYAEARIARHFGDFNSLADMADRGEIDFAVLEEIGRRDHLFPEELKTSHLLQVGGPNEPRTPIPSSVGREPEAASSPIDQEP